MPRHAEFADNEHFQRRAERRCHFKRNRNPASRECENQHIGLVAVLVEHFREYLPSLASIAEHGKSSRAKAIVIGRECKSRAVGLQSSRHTPCAVLKNHGTRSVPTTLYFANLKVWP